MDFQTLNRLLRCGKMFGHSRLRSKELNDTECMICSYILAHAGCSQDEAACALSADKTTVAKALASLEGRGLVERTQDTADKRRKNLRLTAAGLEKTESIADLHDRWLAEVMACLTAAEQRQFEEFCLRLTAAAENLTQKAQKDGGDT